MNADDGRCQEVAEAAAPKEVTAPEIGRSAALQEGGSVQADDLGATGDGRRSDKLDDKPDDKLPPLDPNLARVVEAWAGLPHAVRAGITAMVEASSAEQR